MTDPIRRKVLIYLALITIGVILLSISFANLQFKPGMPIPGADSTPVTVNEAGRSDVQTVDLKNVLQFPLALAFTLTLVVLIVGLVKKANYRLILKVASGLVVLALLMVLINLIKLPTFASSTGTSQGLEAPPLAQYDITPIGEPPQRLFDIVTAIFIVGAVIISVWLLFPILHRPPKGSSIQDEAKTALKAIQNGADLRNVILRCYLQMEQIVREDQGIERKESVTPREFERFLMTTGIPYPPVHQLTGLFEKVRYGRKAFDRKDELSAIECLSAIQSACEAGGQAAQ